MFINLMKVLHEYQIHKLKVIHAIDAIQCDCNQPLFIWYLKSKMPFS